MWSRIRQLAFKLRFVWIQVLFLAGIVWALAPLRDAARLPAPPLPLYTPEPPDLQETLALGSTTFTPGTQGATRVVVYDPRSGQPLPGAHVRLLLAQREQAAGGETVFEGDTDDQGTVNASFRVPADDGRDWALIVETAGRVATQRITRPITLCQQSELSLLSDRSIYRPGETIHLRTRAIYLPDAQPIAGAPLTITVSDARDHRICIASATTSAYGTAEADCALAGQVEGGAYHVSAVLGEQVAAHTVHVALYEAPRFGIRIDAGQPGYVVGERAEVTVTAAYRWGSPLPHARVSLSTSDPGYGIRVQGETDERGMSHLEFDLPETLAAGSSAQGGPSPLSLKVRVAADGATVEATGTLTVAAQPILIAVSPQGMAENDPAWSRALKPGLDNPIAVQTTYPAGRPAECILQGTLERPFEIETDAQGRATLICRPDASARAAGALTMTISALDAQGRQARRQVVLPVQGGEHAVLARPERTAYRVGERMRLDVLVTPGFSAVYLDILRGGQAAAAYAAAYAAPVVDGRATLDISLSAGLSGELVLHAYVLETGAAPAAIAASDVRRVYVDPLRTLDLSALPDRQQYAAGDTARLSLRVRDAQGQERPSLIALAATAGGAVEADAAAPGAPVSDAPVPGAAAYRSWSVSTAQCRTTDLEPVYAGTASKPRPMPESIRQQFDAVESARDVRRRALGAAGERTVWALLCASLLTWIAVLGGTWAERPRPLGRALLGALLALPPILAAAALLAYGSHALFGPGAILVLGLAWLGALLALLVYGRNQGRGWARTLWVLALGHLALLAGLRYALAQGGESDFSLLAASLGALLLTSLSLSVLGLELMRRRERPASAGAWTLALLLPLTLLSGVLHDDGGPAPSTELHPAPTLSPAARTAQVTPTATPPLLLAALAGSSFEPAQAAPAPVVYWAPQTTTDASGGAIVEIPLPDHPGPLNVSAVAYTAQGETGAAQVPLNVTAPLVVESDLPGSLTTGDELSLPVTLYNTLPVSQTVHLTVTQAAWFSVAVRGMEAQSIEVAPYEARTLHLPIQAKRWGAQRLELVVQSDAGRDDWSAPVDVLPNGQRIFRLYEGWIGQLEAGEEAPASRPTAEFKFRVPWGAIQGTDSLTVKLYPNWPSMLLEAADVALQTPPYGARHSLDELAATVRIAALRARAPDEVSAPSTSAPTIGAPLTGESSYALAYQQLLAFEAAEGGFSALEAQPPDLVHTAHALACLSDLSHLYPVDPDLIESTAWWILNRQSPEGAWALQALPSTWRNLPHAELPVTAYVAWSLIEAGYGERSEVERAIEHLERYLDQAQDPYVLALVGNALAAHERATGAGSEALAAALDRLAGQAEIQEGMALWKGDIETLNGALDGEAWVSSAAVERTALATYMLLRTGAYPQLATQGLVALAGNRDPYGTWGAPQVTFLALRALDAAAQGGPALSGTATARVTVAETSAAPVVLRGEGPAQVLVFDELAKGYNDLSIDLEGQALVPLQIVGTYYLAWNQAPPSSPEEEDVSLEVAYDRTAVQVGDTITATVGLMLNRPGVAPLVVLELGLPPGLEPEMEEWKTLQESGVIAHHRREGERIWVYLANLSPEAPVRFQYHLQAITPASVQTLPAQAYDLANPWRPAVREPVRIEVTAGAAADVEP